MNYQEAQAIFFEHSNLIGETHRQTTITDILIVPAPFDYLHLLGVLRNLKQGVDYSPILDAQDYVLLVIFDLDSWSGDTHLPIQDLFAVLWRREHMLPGR